MKLIFDKLSGQCSRYTTELYSTSFGWAVKTLPTSMRQPIFNIYGFVRFADEIVDSFHEFDRAELLSEFKKDTYLAIERGVSLNPILNSFQQVVNHYGIKKDTIEQFFHSMEMDLEEHTYTPEKLKEYVLGSAEVVGLMCLRVFVDNHPTLFQELKAGAMKLGSAFQKINFLRDMKDDVQGLGRTYFPIVEQEGWNCTVKAGIEKEIEEEFLEAKTSILQLPKGAQQGVMLAYNYYFALFKKIQKVSAQTLMKQRMRIPNSRKGVIFLRLMIGNQFT